MDLGPRQRSTNQLPFQGLLRHNDLAIIENPLRRIPEERLRTYIEFFYEEYHLVDIIDIDILLRGARLAREKEGFVAEETAAGTLSDVDKAALNREKTTTIWTESREIKIVVLVCCVGSITQGWVSKSALKYCYRLGNFGFQWYEAC